MKIIDRFCPNFGERRDGKKPYMIILHYTDTLTVEQALSLWNDGENPHEASSHYIVDTDGTIIRVVSEDKRAWHAGVSKWEDETDVNSCSLGIEIQNPGHLMGYEPFPQAQIDAVHDLCADLVKRYAIKPYHILAHSDVSPLRKKDPGELFPWEHLADRGIGLWFEHGDGGRDAIDPEDLRPLLVQYGYNADVDIFALITAFQRHFEPEIFQTPDMIGTPSSETRRRLESLITRKHV